MRTAQAHPAKGGEGEPLLILQQISFSLAKILKNCMKNVLEVHKNTFNR